MGATPDDDRRFRAVFEGALDAMVILDDDGVYVDANPAACELYGLSRERFIGRRIGDFSESSGRARETWNEALRAGSYRGEWRVVRPDGTSRDVEVATSGELFPGRRLGVLRDVTDRKRAEEHRASVFERVSDAFVALDTEWRYTYVNQRAAQTFGRTPAQLIGRHIWTEFPEGVGQPFYHAYHRAAREQIPLQIEEYYPPYGRWFENRIYPSRDGLSIFFQDITDRKRAEEAVRSRERELSLIYDNVSDVIFHLAVEPDGHFRFVSVNRAFVDATGLAEENIVGRLVEEVIPGPALALVLESYGKAIRDRRTVSWEEVSEYPSGRKVGVVTVTPFFEGTGAVTHLIGTVHDVTEQKRAEEEIRQSSARLRALSERLRSAREEEATRIARELHDELGQALTGLKLDIGALEKELGPGTGGPRTSAVGAKITEMSRAVDETVRTVRRIATELRPSILDDLGLEVALEWVAREFQERSGIAVRLEAPGKEIPLDAAGATAAFRIVQEALTNVARHARAGRVWIEIDLAGDGVTIRVADDGVGIALESSAGGQSLGLLGMRERALAAGGRVSVAPRESGGTRVTLWLPSKGEP